MSAAPGGFVPEFVSSVLQIADGQILETQATTDVPMTSVTRQQLQMALKEVDKAMIKAKEQVKDISTAHLQEFEQGYVMAKNLHERIVAYYRGMSDAVEIVHAKPNGLEARLSSLILEQETVERELQETLQVIGLLESLDGIQADMKKFNDAFDDGRLDEAVDLSLNLSHATENLPGDDVVIVKELLERIKDVAAQLDTRLEDLLQKAWSFDSESLTVHQTCNNVPLSTVLNALARLPRETIVQHLRPFARNLTKHILLPLLTNYGGVEQIKQRLELVEGGDWTEKPVEEVYDALEQTLGFVQRECFLNHQEFKIIGSFFWVPLSKALIQNYLEPLVPDSVDDLPKFDEISLKTSQFEDLISERGWIPQENNMDLQRYCRTVDHQFVAKKQSSILAKLREIVNKDDHKLIRVGKDSPWEEARRRGVKQPIEFDGDWKVVPTSGPGGSFESFTLDVSSIHPEMEKSLFTFPNCVISKSTLTILELVNDVLRQALECSRQSDPTRSNDFVYISTNLVMLARSILDLTRSLIPLKHAKEIESVPALAMQLHNDAMFLGHECLTLGAKWKPLIPQAAFSDLVLEFRALAEQIFNTQIGKQRGELLAILRAGEGFDAMDVDRKEDMDRVIRQVAYQLTHLAKAWKPILPTHIALKALGKCADACLKECVGQVMFLTDISEDECGRIAEVLDNLRSGILKMVVFVADIATTNLDPVQILKTYVPNYDKFVLTSELLTSSFADIMERFRRGELSKFFTRQELIGMIKALFADTPLKVKNLAEISSSNVAE